MLATREDLFDELRVRVQSAVPDAASVTLSVKRSVQ